MKWLTRERVVPIISDSGERQLTWRQKQQSARTNDNAAALNDAQGWLSCSIADKLVTFNNLTGASMAKPIVCLVTPADPNDQTSKSRDAEHELSNVGWSSPSIEFHAYYGYYDKKLLKAVADKAVKKAEAAIKAGQPAAIVAAGDSQKSISLP
jgi:hypothetical protein